MKCTNHPDRAAAGYCRNCGKPLCQECTRDVRGALYCEPCLASLVAMPTSAAPVAERSAPSPGVALGLGFIPGLGAVYNGDYVKALVHVLVFGGLVAAQSSDVSGAFHAFLGIALAAFYLYMPIDAYHAAKRMQAGDRGEETLIPPVFEGHHRPLGAIILIVLGVFLLFANLGWLKWNWFSRLWPLALVLMGVWLLIERLKRNA
jgi:hypothetical protein